VKLRDEEQPTGEFYDRFRGRVMFPICNHDNGEVIAFSGPRAADRCEGSKIRELARDHPLHEGAVLFGLHKSKRALIDKGAAIVCEGQLDLITAYEAGVQNVIAPQGTAFTEKQAHILKRFVEEVVLCFDSDPAGQKAAERSLGPLLFENLAVRIAEMPAGEDPDSLIRTRGAEAFAERITGARDFFDFQIDRLRPSQISPRRAVRCRPRASWRSSRASSASPCCAERSCTRSRSGWRYRRRSSRACSSSHARAAVMIRWNQRRRLRSPLIRPCACSLQWLCEVPTHAPGCSKSPGLSGWRKSRTQG
jgi:DNA primase